jgi:hypothetical protein
MLNILNGGAHADTDVDIRVHDRTDRRETCRGAAVGRGDYPLRPCKEGLYRSGRRGSFAPNLPSSRERRPDRRGDRAGLHQGRELHWSDGYTEFYKDGAYQFSAPRSAAEMASYYATSSPAIRSSRSKTR